jgi:hypothetical protein
MVLSKFWLEKSIIYGQMETWLGLTYYQSKIDRPTVAAQGDENAVSKTEKIFTMDTL